ncbi:MAG: type VI secretion system baseplate subunit TssF, partial [Bacteroidales bacterium]|nr:type VI secretion system baseplate subunit TssF [Bacteroidales bacterium]
MHQSKEEILARMLKIASEEWNIPVSDILKSDPLISILLQAVAYEIERLERQYKNTEEIIFQRMADMLTPVELISPFPSRAVAKAFPSGDTQYITPEYNFYCYKRSQSVLETTELEVHFTPVANHKLVNGKILYLVSGKNIFRSNDKGSKSKSNIFKKELIITGKSNKKIPGNNFWVGLQIPSGFEGLENLSFFFDLESKDSMNKRIFLDAIKTSQWSS